MEKSIANRRPTLEEIEFSKRMGTVDEARRRIINAGGYDMFQSIIDDPMFLGALMEFHRNYAPNALGYAALLKWFQENKLEKHLQGGSLEKQIKAQEIFYQKFYGKKFHIDRGKIFIDSRRLLAIKAGLEADCLNYALVKAVPLIGSIGWGNAETGITGARFFYERIMKPLKEEGFQIWAETSIDRWTKLTLEELLRRGISIEPEEFNGDNFKMAWVAEIIRLITGKRPSLVIPGMVDIVFTSNIQDIPANQIIVNKDGRIVELRDRSYISAIVEKVRVVSKEEEMILACQRYVEDKTYLAPKTWDWLRDVVDHRDKGTSPGVSCGVAGSLDSELSLYSSDADDSGSDDRLRPAL